VSLDLNTALPVALAGGTWIFIGVVVALFFVVVFGYYTRSGSGISQRPYRRPGEPPEAPSELAHDTTIDPRNWERGTEGHHRRPRPSGAGQPVDPQVAEALAAWRAARRVSTPRLEPPIGPTDRARGRDGAPMIAIYIDVSAEPCRSAYKLLLEFVDAGRVRVAIRQLPLADVHELALAAAEALEAAADQGKFFELLDDLAASGVTDETGLLERATRHVADPERLKQDVQGNRHRDSVVEQIHQATSSAASSVPELYIDGVKYNGPITRDDIGRALRA
jgi:protein-disulfide isomerase